MRFSLLKELAITDFKLRYKSSILGYLWSLLKPLAYFGSLYVVFSLFMRFDIENYPLFLLLGIIIWQFLVEATTNGMNSLVTKASLLTKLNVNKFTIVFASNLTTLLTLGLNLIVFFILLAIMKPELDWTMLLLPIIIAELFLVALGLSLALSVLYVKMRDLGSIWDIVIQIGFWVTPIIYPLKIIPEKYIPYVVLNPMFRIIDQVRSAVIRLEWPDYQFILISLGISVLIFLVGYAVFRAKADYVSEEL